MLDTACASAAVTKLILELPLDNGGTLEASYVVYENGRGLRVRAELRAWAAQILKHLKPTIAHVILKLTPSSCMPL